MARNNPLVQVNTQQARREIQATWSQAERWRRRQVAEQRQQALVRLLSVAPHEHRAPHRFPASVPAA
jgi:hypothetical protein